MNSDITMYAVHYNTISQLQPSINLKDLSIFDIQKISESDSYYRMNNTKKISKNVKSNSTKTYENTHNIKHNYMNCNIWQNNFLTTEDNMKRPKTIWLPYFVLHVAAFLPPYILRRVLHVLRIRNRKTLSPVLSPTMLFRV